MTKAATARKPRTPKLSTDTPAARPFSEAVEREPDVARIPETSIVHVQFGLLRRAPENVRHTAKDDGVLELADDIAAHGLLQSLIGYQQANFPGAATFTFIVGGGRRLQALEILHGRGAIDDEYLVPVLVRPKIEAVELSLSENLARRDMNPADEFEAFATLMDGGAMSPAGLAKRFGFTERYVKQRLRLAELAPEILDALRERKITLDAAMAYASTQNRPLQSELFKKQSKSFNPHDPKSIRVTLSQKVINTNDVLFRFIGAQAYESAGGRYDDDLFNAAGEHRRVLHPLIVSELAHKRISCEMGPKRVEMAIKTPSCMGFVVSPDLRIHRWGPSTDPAAPEGYVMVKSYDLEKQWKTIRNNGIMVQVVVGIDDDAKLTIWPNMVFVEKGQESAVMPRGVDRPTPQQFQPMSDADRREIWRQAGGRAWAARLAVPKLSSLPGFEGRAFYERDDRFNEHKHPITGAPGGYFAIHVYVTEEELAANLEAGLARYDAEKLDAERRKAETEAAKQAEADATNDRVAQILALDPPPFAVVADSICFYRWADGSYRDAFEEDGEAAVEFDADDLESLLNSNETIDQVFATEEDCGAGLAIAFEESGS